MIRRFLEDLLFGDAVALTVVGVVAAIGGLLCLGWWKTARDLKREDEERAKRHGKAKRKAD